MTRAYLRTDPDLFARKAIEQGYPPAALGAFQAVLCLAESQRPRGHFLSLAHLRALLSGPGGKTVAYAKWIPYLVEHGDIVEEPSGQVYPPGWNEWQEGDSTVGERMQRVRNRRATEPKPTPRTVKKRTPRRVTKHTDATVTNGTAPTDTSTVTRPSARGQRGGEAERRRDNEDVVERVPDPNLPLDLVDPFG